MTSPLATLARRLSRDTTLYASVSGVTFAMGLVSVAALTRLLTPAEFGVLALHLVFAAMLTILYNAGSLQGALLVGFGGSEEGLDDADRDRHERLEPRAVLGSAGALTIVISAAGTAVVILLAAPLAELLSGERDATGAVVWAALAGATGAVWRLASQVPRFERRPLVFVVVSNLRSVGSVAASVAAVAAGWGIEGALAATAGGTLLATLVALVASRRSWSLRPQRRATLTILREGRLFVFAVIGVWIVQNVDLYLVGAFAEEQLPAYRVASRLGSGASYAVSAFLLAWAPLSASALHRAAQRQRGAEHMSARIVTLFLVVTLWIVLALTVLADVLVRIAPAAYAEAAQLVPLLALGFLAYGLFLVLYRTVRLPDKRRAYAGLAVLAAVVFGAAAVVLTPRFGGRGAAAAQVLAFGLACAGMLALSARAGHPAHLERGRLLLALLVGGGCLAAQQALAAALGDARVVTDALLLLVVFPALVVLAGIVPRREALTLLRAVGSAWSPRSDRRRRRRVEDRLERLDPDRGELLLVLLRRRLPLPAAAGAFGLSEAALLARAVEALAFVAATRAPAQEDRPAVGDFLFARRAPAERDRLSRELAARGVDPGALHDLEVALGDLRRLGRAAWRKATYARVETKVAL